MRRSRVAGMTLNVRFFNLKFYTPRKNWAILLPNKFLGFVILLMFGHAFDFNDSNI